MADTGIIRFPGTLDPRAQEFRPNNPTNQLPAGTTLPPPTQQHVLYPYTSPYPPISELRLVPYTQFPVPVAYVIPGGAPPPLSPSVQSPSNSAATRSLLLSLVPRDVSESTVRMELETFGEVRGVQMERVKDGIVTVHFYDLRHAERALREIRNQHMQQQSRLRNYYNALMLRNCGTDGDEFPGPVVSPAVRGLISGHAVWAQFIIPTNNAVPDGYNQGTVVVFNLDSEVSTSSLREIFEAFGPVKELRETPLKKHQRFVEFFDIRDAAKALEEMNGKEINGKQVVMEFSRPGGHNSRKFLNPITTSPTFCTNSQYYPINIPDYQSPHPPPPPPPPAPPLSHRFSPRPASYARPRSYQAQFSTEKVASFSNVNRNEEEPCSGLRRNSKTKSQNDKSNTVTSKQQQPSKNRLRKNKQIKQLDSRFLIDKDGMVESDYRDSRTTVMIKNIPNKYSLKLLLNMLDNHCIHCNEQIADGDDQPLSAYDFVYLPIDFNNKCNVGYGFVNMTSPEATWRLYKAFHLQHWEVFNSRKICEVTYARVQGLEALKEHFKNSKFPCETEHFLPVLFSPPRDGKQLVEPLPIAGHRQPIGIPTTPSGPPPVVVLSDEDDDEIDDPDRLLHITNYVHDLDMVPGAGSCSNHDIADRDFSTNPDSERSKCQMEL